MKTRNYIDYVVTKNGEPIAPYKFLSRTQAERTAKIWNRYCGEKVFGAVKFPTYVSRKYGA